MRKKTFALALALLLSPLPGTAQSPPPAAPPPAAPSRAQLQLSVRREKLENGLRVVLSVDHTSPTIAVDVMYDVGGRNEERGRSGFAHLFEHMMFQGSRNVARGEHFKLVSGHGGTLNGTTNSDRTNYYELLPQSELALALWLEANRMKALDISQKNFENQRAVVKEEYRMRVENVAYVPASIRLDELVFQGYWPYEHTAIGTMKDLDAAELGWVRAFHDAYYGPNDAVLSISGDLEPEATMAMVRRYFGDAKPIAAIPPYDPGPMPEQTAPRDDVMLDAHAKLPALILGWAIPKKRDPDHYALELAGALLSDGESSRLYKIMVRDRAVALEVDASTSGHRGPDAFEIEAKLAKGAKVADVEKIILAELAEVAKNGPTEDEMKKLRTRMEASFLLGLQSNFARAAKLAEFELFYGDASLLNGELARYVAVTRADVQRVVAKYLTLPRRSRVEVKPAEMPAPAPKEKEMNRPILCALALAFAAACGHEAASPGPQHADLPGYAPSNEPSKPSAGPPREHPPASAESKPSPFPAVQAQTLKNGLAVEIVEIHALPIVQIRIVVHAGMGYAPKQPGLADITATLLKDGGTRSMTSADLLRRIEGLGADLSVSVGVDSTVLGTAVTKDRLAEALGLVGEVVQSPRFDERELGKLKTRESDEAEDQLRSSGQFTAMHALFRELFPKGSPYAVYGALPSDIAKINAAAVRDFHAHFFVPKNATVVVVGDVTRAEATAQIERVFGNWAGEPPPRVEFPAVTPPTARKILVASRPKSAQSDVFVAGFGVPRTADTWPEARVANQVLGGGVSGRLFLDVREQRSLAYSAYSRIVELSHGDQPAVLYAGTQTEKTADAVTGLLENMEKITQQGVTDGEVETARRYLSDVFAIRMETVGSIADMVAELWTLSLPYDYWDRYRDAVRRTTATAASNAASKLYHPAASVLAIAGDADAIAPKLTRFGEVTVIDPEHEFATIRTLPAETK